MIRSSILLLSLLFAINALAEKKVFKSYKSGEICTQATRYKSIKKACRAKNPPEGVIYECKKKCVKRKRLKCKKHEWKIHDQGQCSKNKEKKGYYVENCGGSAINAKSLKKACAQKKAKGKTVVFCKNGKEKRRQTCSSAKNNESTKNQTRVFINKCGGKIAKSKSGRDISLNLNKACRSGNYKNKALVRCNNKCTKRTGLKCQRWTWIEKERKICGSKKTNAKIKSCNESETKAILNAYKKAASKVRKIKNTAQGFISNTDRYLSQRKITMTKKEKSKNITMTRKSISKFNKILTMLNKRKSKFICPGNSKECTGALAYTFNLKKALEFCPGFFTADNDTNDIKLDQIGTLVHEYSHNAGTDDITYDRDEIQKIDWSNNAETYEAWVEGGDFCIPGFEKNCMAYPKDY